MDHSTRHSSNQAGTKSAEFWECVSNRVGSPNSTDGTNPIGTAGSEFAKSRARVARIPETEARVRPFLLNVHGEAPSMLDDPDDAVEENEEFEDDIEKDPDEEDLDLDDDDLELEDDVIEEDLDDLIDDDDDDDEDDDEDEEESKPRARKVSSDDDEDEDVDPDDVEADLDAILRDRLAASDDDEDEDEDGSSSSGGGPRGEEFACPSCFLLVNRSQISKQAEPRCPHCGELIDLS